MIQGITSKRVAAGMLTTYPSSLSRDELDTIIKGQEALAFAFVNVEPTKELVAQCYGALASAGAGAAPLSFRRAR